MPLAVSGAYNVFFVMHAVCSCIKVPLVVSGAGTVARYGILCVSCIKVPLERICCHACCVFLHQGALSGVGCKDTWQVWCVVCSCSKVPLVVSGAGTLCSVLYFCVP